MSRLHKSMMAFMLCLMVGSKSNLQVATVETHSNYMVGTLRVPAAPRR